MKLKGGMQVFYGVWSWRSSKQTMLSNERRDGGMENLQNSGGTWFQRLVDMYQLDNFRVMTGWVRMRYM